MKTDYDVVIIGGGPAGLSAGLVLGRCLRKVLICDNQEYRNRYASQMNGYLTRDGIAPDQFREIAHNELKKYPFIKLIHTEVVDIKKEKAFFNIFLNTNTCITARKVLMAIGRKDSWPTLPGATALYGKSIFHCPYCDGWEWQGKALATYSKGDKGADYSLLLRQWSKDVIYFTNGPSKMSPDRIELLKKHQIKVYQDPIIQLESQQGLLKKIVLQKTSISRDAIFFDNESYQHPELTRKLGCALDKEDKIIFNKLEISNMDGIFVAGDVCHDVFQAISSAGQGAEAAIYINGCLVKEDQ